MGNFFTRTNQSENNEPQLCKECRGKSIPELSTTQAEPCTTQAEPCDPEPIRIPDHVANSSMEISYEDNLDLCNEECRMPNELFLDRCNECGKKVLQCTCLENPQDIPRCASCNKPIEVLAIKSAR